MDGATSHYVPLHSSPAGLRYGRAHESLGVTEAVSNTLLRLPMWVGLPSDAPPRAARALSAVSAS
jgi:dTDP-4-amino-4,6-dideoxygalactose transaminase